MTTLRENFRPVSDVLPTVRRDFVPANRELTNPQNPLSFLDGEWMTLDSAGKLIRAVNIATAGVAAGGALCWPLWAENGRYDVQAMAEHKTPIIWLNDWEFETRIFDAGAAVGNGLAITTMLQAVKVASVAIGGTYGTRILSGLVGHGGSGDSDRVVGYVTRLPAANGGWLRIRGGNNY
jgi:hypothetical protein